MTQAVETPSGGPNTGNGVTTAFPYNYYLDSDNDIEVTLYDTDGVGVIQTLATHYTVDGVGAGSGNINFVTAPASGEVVRHRRIEPRENLLNLVNQGDYDADAVEGKLDDLVRMVQDLAEHLDRAFIIPIGDSTTVEVGAIADRASTYLSFDASGNLISTVSVSGVTVSGTPAAGEVLAWNAGGYYEPVSNVTIPADGDYGDITITGGVWSIDPSAIDYATLAAALLSGSDTTLVTGTEGADGTLGAWNADGDLVEAVYANYAAPVHDDQATATGNLTWDMETDVLDADTTGNVTLNALGGTRTAALDGQVKVARLTLGGAHTISNTASVFKLGDSVTFPVGASGNRVYVVGVFNYVDGGSGDYMDIIHTKLVT